ncbi:MAG: MFS transporter [Berryella intestinalis]|uniref:MFS transporter n=1 Tax=Berryella intestinalis TaxID=1531429 RepID=UPI002A75783E|nr:MFS transporter [Berryella intestinalis]MDY3130087.1 MFS transporter [Berryella intestinalis]
MAETEGNYKPMLSVLFGTAFVAAFNENIVNVGLADIMAAFDVTASVANWLVTGYMIVTAVVVSAVAFALGRFTLRSVFFFGAGVFAAGSLLASFAPSFELLLAFRLLQALGTGLFIPMMMSTVLALVPRRRLGAYLAAGGAAITFGPAFGPVVSGAMVTLAGWRAMFLPSFAAMLLFAVAGWRFVSNVGETERGELDVFSLGLSAAGLTALVYGVSRASEDAPSAVAALLVGIGVLSAFVVRQKSMEHPFLNLSPLLNPRFSPACCLVVVAMMTTFSMSVLLPLYFEGAAHATALAAGALVLPPVLVNAATALVGGRIMDAKGEWPLLPVGFSVILVGQVAAFFAAGQGGALPVVAASALTYGGVGLVFSPSQTAGLRRLPRSLNASGVGIMSVLIQVAAAIGPSLFVGAMSAALVSGAEGGAAGPSDYVRGFQAAVAIAAGVAAIGVVLAFWYAFRVSGTVAEGAASTAPRRLSLANVMKGDAYRVGSEDPVYRAVEIMVERRTGGLPVVDSEGSLVGFVSDGDIMKSLADRGGAGDLSFSLAVYANDRGFDERVDRLMRSLVSEVATRSVVSVQKTASIERVCAILGERRIKKLPVLDGSTLVGTVSRSDVTRALMASFVEKGRPKARG